jgi:lysyl-tRNA synthetase class 2
VSLTGVPLIALAILATMATIAGTVLLWSRFGRWRLVSRTVGVLLAETLTVLSIGLIVNRVDGFYPSWQALSGDTGTTVVTAMQRAGRLDNKLHGTGAAALPWHPASGGSWRLVGAPTMVTPTGYTSRAMLSYPAVLDLVDPGPDGKAAVTAARGIAAVSVVAVPSAATTAAALASLPADLSGDVRATTRGWAIVATAKRAALAERLIAAAPGRFGALVVIGAAPPPQVAEGIAVAVVRSVPSHGGKAVRPPAGLTELASAASAFWHTAIEWAAGQTSLPLAAARQLPAATSARPGPS